MYLIFAIILLLLILGCNRMHEGFVEVDGYRYGGPFDCIFFGCMSKGPWEWYEPYWKQQVKVINPVIV